jgi:Saxitoxin biosynthesis operon protein SxtJ
MSTTLPEGPPSEKRFGWTLVIAFLVVTTGGLIKKWGSEIVLTFCALAVLLGLVTILSPRTLMPLNRAWFLLGRLMGRVVSPIVLGIIFFGLLTPITFITRLAGRDELQLKRNSKKSYWLDCTKPRFSPLSFRDQF